MERIVIARPGGEDDRPDRAGPWLIGEPLGRGGAGTVYAAQHAETGARGALKLAHPKAGAVRDHWFRREAALGARLRHPNVVPLIDAGHLPDGRPYLVHERVDGPTLQQRATELSIAEIVKLGGEMLDALGYAHDAGVVHCDVTPSNVLLAGTPPTWKAMLIDFGLAKARSDSRTRPSSLTHVSGTPGYLSPEQARGAGSPGPASDLFGCGAVLFFVLTGHAPYGGATAVEVVYQTLTSTPLPLRPREGLRAPVRLAEVVQRLLARDPEHRFASAASARRAWLDAAATHTPAAGAVRPLVPRALGLQSMETIELDSVRVAERPATAFSTARATPFSAAERGEAPAPPNAPEAPEHPEELARALGVLPPVGAGVVAVSGAGTSAFLRAAREALRGIGVRVAFVRGRRTGQSAPMEALATLALDCIGAAELTPAALAAERLTTALAERGLRDEAGLDALVGGLLGVGPLGAPRSAVMQAFEAMERLLDPDRRPFVLVIDDADGIDEGTWDVVRALTRRPSGGVGVVWASGARETPPEDTRIALAAPDAERLDRMWERLTASHTPRQAEAATIGDLRTLAASAVALGAMSFDALVDAMDLEVLTMAQVAATFGGDVPRRALPRVTELMLERPIDHDVLDRLVRARVLVEVEHSCARRERWARIPSPALRARLLERLTPQDRERASGLAAQWLARDCMDDTAANRARMADVALAAKLPSSAAHALFEAGRLEVEGGRPAAAAPHLVRALSLVENETEQVIDRPHALAWLAAAALHAARPAETEELGARAWVLVEEERPVLRAQIAHTRADAAIGAGRFEDAVQHLRTALDVLGAEGDPMELARAHASLGWVLGYRMGRNDEGITHGRRALEVAARISAPAFRASLCGKLGANYLRAGDWDGQLATNETDLALSTQAHDIAGIVRANINLGVCYTNRGDLPRARAHTERALELAERCGSAGSAQIAHNNLAMIALDDGRLGDVTRHADAVLEGARRTGYRRALPETFLTLARLALRNSELEVADRMIVDAERDSDVADSEVIERVRAKLELARATPDAALARMQALVVKHEHDPYERAASRLTLATVLRALARPTDAAAQEALADTTFRTLGASLSLERSRWS